MPASAVFLSLLVAASGCVSIPPQGDPPNVDEESAARWPAEAWKATLSTQTFAEVDTSVHYISADDGTQLSLTLQLPRGLPAGQKVPTLLEFTAYQALRTSGPFVGTGPAARGTDIAPESFTYYVHRGAAFVEADARGSNASGGCLDFGGSTDRSDAATFVAWIRSQPWSNGVIVSDGLSYPGMGSVLTHTADPQLTAAMAQSPVVSFYLHEWTQGAKQVDAHNGPIWQRLEVTPSLYADPRAVNAQPASCTGRTFLDWEHVEGPFTDLWADRDLSRHNQNATAPIIIAHGFADPAVQTNNFQIYWDSLPENFPKYLLLGWWGHGVPNMNGHPAQTFDDLRHRWLDATLFGKENGLWTEPRVLVEDSQNVWREGHEWPLEPSDWTTWSPQPGGILATSASHEGSESYPDLSSAQRGTWTGSNVIFRTEPLESQRLINGQPEFHLVASSSQPATKWVAYLFDEAPDGTRQYISHGHADSHSWGKPSEWLPMEPGKKYSWDIHLLPTAVVVPSGHRVVLLVTSQDVGTAFTSLAKSFCFSDYHGGCYSPTGILPSEYADRTTNTVYLGPDATHLRFAWADPDLVKTVSTANPSE